jgi:ectoine hydroxylase-related dioxygenase (phytanoyl-CoA dioxygenase family)
MTRTEGGTLVPAELVAQFREQGFVVVPGLITDDELDHYGALVTEAVRYRTSGDTVPLEEKSRYQQSFIQCMNLWEDFPEIRKLTFHQAIGQAAAELLGVDVVRLWHDQALYKQAGGRATDPHQDHPYWPIHETASVTAWIPFAGSTMESGAMAYVPGSHAIGLRKFVNIFFGEPHDLLADSELVGIEPVYVEVPKGSVAFHHGLTVHLAAPNTTSTDRAVHTVIYFPDGSTRGYPYPHFAVDRAGIEVGSAIDGDVTPIVWPRSEGDLPDRPPVPFTVPAGIANAGAVPTV